ncbi:acyl-CoA dehydrogenase family protein [Roseimaritima ulvae]|uniref:Acyl-CoA dehydrogenase n=1 Tax=Roseimaritima ulvae TaxID=980254 RepID=A0A5B9QVJ2_9BACT|nr:acyl-CoA dehydrogenase family protein [Roseimaritima ulvae]QEG41919.1 Acyl-CoA dehydrogenase [Roseimaritima ulvae]
MSADAPKRPDTNSTSFAETALRLGGASDDESRRTGALDTADDQVEMLFAPQYQTANSPIHRAVWDRRVPTELFAAHPMTGRQAMPDDVAETIARCVGVVRGHKQAGTLLNEHNKIADQVLHDLAAVGYWGLLVDRQYGGRGFDFKHFAQLITQMATVDPTVAGLASVHGCIGAVDPVRTFGTAEQRQRFLPRLASGERLSAFALTEPCAGSDLTALRTTAVRDGDDYVVNGEKLFITNVLPGRTIGLVCLIDQRPAVLITDLPAKENEHFSLRRYGIYALKHTNNHGIVFRDFRVPVKNRLKPVGGDGLTIAYHGLNLGRIALCANAAGAMRMMLADMLPWAHYRQTYGQAIEKRELVRRRMGRLAGLIVGCDALVGWCSDLIDEGYRGEMECVIAKIFGSEAQKEAAIELYMKTHGGRSFLHGHLFGDNVHEFLAPCIYEGEGEMLGMALFKSLVKQHGREYFESIGQTLAERNVQSPNLLNPRHAWMLRKSLWRYATWMAGRTLRPSRWTATDEMSQEFERHVKFAQKTLSGSGDRISATMRKFQLKLTERQCRISALSQRVQDATVMLVTALYGAQHPDPITRQAADCLCRQLHQRITGRATSDRDFAAVTRLGQTIAEQGWQALDGVSAEPIKMPYRSPHEADNSSEGRHAS